MLFKTYNFINVIDEKLGQMDYSLMWEKILTAHPLLNKSIKNTQCTEEELEESFEIIKNLNFHNHVENLAFNEIERKLRQDIVPKFWSYFNETDTEITCFYGFKNAVQELYCELSEYIIHITNLQKLNNYMSIKSNTLDNFKLIVRASLLAQLPPYHTRTLKYFYEVSFKVFCKLEDGKGQSQTINSTSDNSQCTGCLQETVHCACQNIYEIFCNTNSWLVELNLLEPLVGQVLTSLIHIRIENYIEQICKESFDVSFTQHLEKWLNLTVMSWLYKIYCIQNIDQCSGEIQESMEKYHQKLTHFLYETYTMTRINQLFNIIIEYPDSLPAVEDLHNCLPKTDLRPVLINKLQKALETRLLHPGVSTPDILTAYVAAIRSLRELDPSGVLLDLVTQPVHQYLRSREDTVRCVVGSLTEEGPSDLADELAMAETLNDENNPEEDNRNNWELWKPDPIDVIPVPDASPKHKRTSDIISMLVNVYGSKELFVNEYKTLLADRLLSQYNCNTEKEVRYLELLKLRFGETQLHYCEVMLKDITDSKRINSLLQKDEQYKEESKDFPVTALVLSAQFWPSFKEETLELPPLIREQFQYYTGAFETLKGNRTLCWKPHLGSVELNIELRDRTISLTVSPIHATIIMHFEEQEQWTIDELSQVMKVPATLLRKKIIFWQSQGILKETSNNVFLLIEESASKGKASTSTDIVCEDDESESVMASYQDQREEELQVFWSYIIGMLTNLDSMTLERIHQMLKMFASQGPSAVECSLQELRVFLDRKVREHKLLLSGGYYRLPKN